MADFMAADEPIAKEKQPSGGPSSRAIAGSGLWFSGRGGIAAESGSNEGSSTSGSAALVASMQAEVQALSRTRRALGRQPRQASPTAALAEDWPPNAPATGSRSPKMSDASSDAALARGDNVAEGLKLGAWTPAALKAEAAALTRAHRALRGGGGGGRRSATADAAVADAVSQSQQKHYPGELLSVRSPLLTSRTDREHIADPICPACGRGTEGVEDVSWRNASCQALSAANLSFQQPPSPGAVAALDAEKDQLQARVDVLETLLEKAKFEAGSSAILREELCSERARVVDLAQALAAMKRLAEELHAGYVEQSKEFARFVAEVRSTAALAAPTVVCSCALDATVNLASALYMDPPDLVAEKEALQKERSRMARHLKQQEENERVIGGLRGHLKEESASLASSRRHSLALSTTHDELQSELEARCKAAGSELDEERTRRKSVVSEMSAQQSTLLELREGAQSSETELARLREELQRQDVEMGSLRDEDRALRQSFVEKEAHAVQAHSEGFAAAEKVVAARTAVETKASRVSVRTMRHTDEASQRRREGVAALKALDKGAVMQKLSAKHNKWQSRFAGLSKNRDEFRWSDRVKQQSHAGRSATVLKVKDIARLDVGEEFVPASARPSNCPWHIFVVWSHGRSYCFWSASSDVVAAFVIGLSALSPTAPPISGKTLRLKWAYRKLGTTPRKRMMALMSAVKGTKLAPHGILKPAPAAVVTQPGVGSGGGRMSTHSAAPSSAGRVSWHELPEVREIPAREDEVFASEGSDPSNPESHEEFYEEDESGEEEVQDNIDEEVDPGPVGQRRYYGGPN
eukprot:TRINITY_DN7463_c0_g2_i3.p1 TRINITY_DN7463_c0_g2~~TRINITY_DN7463_c0_g2_i3.p1  ORF type:complete len:811 (+),score=217.57 TRINITY_DN7463_c0_g2_i3:129-2561(+)